MADLGEEAFSSQMKVVATFLRLLEELISSYFFGVSMPLFASLTLVKETALKEAASLKSPLLTSFIENYVRRQKLFLTNEQIGK